MVSSRVCQCTIPMFLTQTVPLPTHTGTGVLCHFLVFRNLELRHNTAAELKCLQHRYNKGLPGPTNIVCTDECPPGPSHSGSKLHQQPRCLWARKDVRGIAVCVVWLQPCAAQHPKMCNIHMYQEYRCAYNALVDHSKPSFHPPGAVTSSRRHK